MRKPIEKMYVKELRHEVYIMRAVLDGQVEYIKNLRAEIERLKAIDRAIYDYKGEIAKAEYERFRQEGFDEVVTSRPLVKRKLGRKTDGT